MPDILICIFQRGGMDGLSAVIPYGDTDYYRLRSKLAVQPPSSSDPKSAIDLDGFFGLNPALKALKPAWDQGYLAIVHASGSPDPTHSHFDAQDYMERGTPGEKKISSGWLNRHLQSTAVQVRSPFRAVGIGSILPASLRGPYPLASLVSIADYHLGQKNLEASAASFRTAMEQMYSGSPTLSDQASLTFQALDMVQKIETNAAAAASPKVKYPNTGYGAGLAQIAQLIKANVSLEAAALDILGWDTHAQEGASDGQLSRLLQQLAEGLASFYQDLGELSKQVVVVTMSEFGRRAQENGSAGTDHGHGNVMFILSRNIKASKVYGKWPGLAPDQLVTPGDLAVTTDYRIVLSELLQTRRGEQKLDAVFPDFQSPGYLGIFNPA